MNKRQQQIAEGLAELNQSGDEIFSGVVKSVDEATATMEVYPDPDNEEYYLPVMLRSVVDGLKGIVVIPKKGTEVTYAQIEGAGRWTIVNAAELDKVLIDVPELQLKCDKVVINGGGNEGMAKIVELTNEYRAIQRDINEFKSILNTVIGGLPIPEPGSGSPSALQAALAGGLAKWMVSHLKLTDKKKIQNDKVKH